MTRLSIWIVQFIFLSWLNHRASQHPLNQSETNHKHDNGTIIIVAGSSEFPLYDQPLSSSSQFNERRRDMFIEDHSVKNVQIVDTLALANFSTANNIPKTRNLSKKNSTILLMEPLVNDTNLNQRNAKPKINKQSSKVSNITISNSDQMPFLTKPQRSNILFPRMGHQGRPSCLRSPDDTFCEYVDNYPKATIKEEIDFSVEQFSEIFGSKAIDGRTILDIESDESICSRTPRVIYPKMAKNQANQWIYVVNDVEYTQAVVAEICQRPGKPCAYTDSLPMGMTSKCKQKYSYKRLLALHPTEKRTYPDAFRFPSCCSCYIKMLDYVERRDFRKIDKEYKVIDIQDDSSLSPSENFSINTLETTSISTTETHKFDTTYFPLEINQTFVID